MNANAADDWRVSITNRLVCIFLLELVVCGVCPLPLEIGRWGRDNSSVSPPAPSPLSHPPDHPHLECGPLDRHVPPVLLALPGDAPPLEVLHRRQQSQHRRPQPGQLRRLLRHQDPHEPLPGHRESICPLPLIPSSRCCSSSPAVSGLWPAGVSAYVRGIPSTGQALHLNYLSVNISASTGGKTWAISTGMFCFQWTSSRRDGP